MLGMLCRFGLSAAEIAERQRGTCVALADLVVSGESADNGSDEFVR